jgi:hypothetical protein
MNIDTAVGLAIDNMQIEGITDIFERPFEVDLLCEEPYRTRFRDSIATDIKKHQFKQLDMKPVAHVLVPKSSRQYDYRRAALISPACSIKYLALAILAAPIIEKHRIPIDQKVVFSYRFDPHDGMLFSDEGGYNKWRDEIVARRANEDNAVVVKCDIASFYDRVNLHRLQSTLESIGIEKWLHTTIDHLLKFWVGNDSYGLPVGGNGSRILAEAVLIDVDNYLLDVGIPFVRFVDDYRLFAKDAVYAQKYLAQLTSKLFGEGLSLNAAKTVMYQARKADPEQEAMVEPPALEAPEKIVETFTRMTGRYNTVPRRFTRPTDEKFAAFKTVDISEILNTIEEETIVDFDNMQKALIAILAQEKYEHLEDVDCFIKKCIFGADYIIDMLMKNSENIEASVRDKIRAKMAELLYSGFFSEVAWYEVRLVRLLLHEGYRNEEAIYNYFLSLPRHASELSCLSSLDGFVEGIDRTRARVIRGRYNSACEWEKRRIIRIVAASLPGKEAAAWFRAIRTTVDTDILTRLTFDKYRVRV